MEKALVQTVAPGLASTVCGLHIWTCDIFTALFFDNTNCKLFSLVSWVL